MRPFAATLVVVSLLSSPLTSAQTPAGYYESIDTSSADALRRSIHAIIDDHSKIPYTASSLDTWDVLEMADQDQDQPGNITTVYRNNSVTKQGGGNNFYNREHTWPRSYGFTEDAPDNYPFSDMHALFLADVDYNSARQNQPFADCSSGCTDFPALTNDGRGGEANDVNQTIGEFSQGSWEVWPARRGDMARAMFYMDVRYAGDRHGLSGASEPDLILTDDRALIEAGRSSRNEPTGYMGLLGTLLQWHQQDPVDAIERQHHEAVFAAQGNRNPFIDHPEFVSCVFSADCAALNASIPNLAGLSGAWYDPRSDGDGFNLVVSDAGLTVFFYGYTETGERLWLVSVTEPSEFDFDQAVTVELLQGRGGSFASVAQAELESWGSLTMTFTSCQRAQFVLNGSDGQKAFQAVPLATIRGLDCDRRPN